MLKDQRLSKKFANEEQTKGLTKSAKKSLVKAYMAIGALTILSVTTYFNNQLHFKEVILSSIIISCVLLIRIQELKNS